jgi:homoserine O-acetyltransferase
VQHGFERESEIERCLEHENRAFVDRFDANSLLYLSRPADYFGAVSPEGTLRDAFRASNAAFLFLTFSSGWLYPTYHFEETADAARAVPAAAGS